MRNGLWIWQFDFKAVMKMRFIKRKKNHSIKMNKVCNIIFIKSARNFFVCLDSTLYFYWRWQKLVGGDGTNELLNESWIPYVCEKESKIWNPRWLFLLYFDCNCALHIQPNVIRKMKSFFFPSEFGTWNRVTKMKFK